MTSRKPQPGDIVSFDADHANSCGRVWSDGISLYLEEIMRLVPKTGVTIIQPHDGPTYAELEALAENMATAMQNMMNQFCDEQTFVLPNSPISRARIAFAAYRAAKPAKEGV